MRYRSKVGQAIHTAILGFLHEQHDIGTVKDVMAEAAVQDDGEALMEISVNGHSHLIDILHLSNEIVEEKSEAARKSSMLLEAIFQVIDGSASHYHYHPHWSSLSLLDMPALH